jgi:hypothetical protein
MNETTDGRKWVSAPYQGPQIHTGSINGVWVNPTDEVEWNWSHTPQGSFISGYSIKTRGLPVPPIQESEMKMTGMTFGAALEQVKKGKRMRRLGWDSDEFIFLVPGSTFKVNRPPLLGIYPEGTEVKYHAHIDRHCRDGQIMPWVPNQPDLLDDDWEVKK